MRVVRQTPRAINLPMLVLGVERRLAALLIMFSSLLYSEVSKVLGIVLFIGGCYAAKRMSRKDPDLLVIGWQASKLAPIYDSVKREVKR